MIVGARCCCVVFGTSFWSLSIFFAGVFLKASTMVSGAFSQSNRYGVSLEIIASSERFSAAANIVCLTDVGSRRTKENSWLFFLRSSTSFSMKQWCFHSKLPSPDLVRFAGHWKSSVLMPFSLGMIHDLSFRDAIRFLSTYSLLYMNYGIEMGMGILLAENSCVLGLFYPRCCAFLHRHWKY